MINQIRIFLGLILLLFILSCKYEKGTSINEEIVCDAELLTADSQLFLSTGGNYTFDNIKARTDKNAHSGAYSIKLTKTNPYGFSFTLKNVIPDSYYEVSVWKKGKTEDGLIVGSSPDLKSLYISSWKVSETGSNGWEKVILDLNIPPHYIEGRIKVFVWNKGEEDIFFDDIKIVRKLSKIYPKYDSDILRIFIDTSDIIKLKNKRFEAFNNGILESRENDWVDAILFENDNMLKAEVRLKGDWLDHLYGDKWSFRINLKNDHTWKGFKTFSIHTPLSRDFINEWFFHKLLDEEEVLSTRYGFIPVELNGKSLGIYAFEEHFEKQLIESKKRREGPILKLTEDLFWIYNRDFVKQGKSGQIPYYEASEIEAFKQNRIISDPQLRNHFLIAQNLVNQFKWREKPVSEIFNIDPIAKYLAMANLSRAYHGLAWHNLRFYYNPVLSNLELIGFDCFSELGVSLYNFGSILGSTYIEKPKNNIVNENLLLYHMFSDSAFVDLYVNYLEKYSAPEFLYEFFEKNKDEVKNYDEMIKREFNYYDFDIDSYLTNAKLIRDALPSYKEAINNKVEVLHSEELMVKYDSTYQTEYAPALVKAFNNNTQSGLNNIEVRNYFPGEITLIGAGKRRNKIDNYFLHPENMESYNISNNSLATLVTDTLSKYLFFRVTGNRQVFYTLISDWQAPGFFNPRQELFADINLEIIPFCKISDKKIIFIEGKHRVENNIIIPKGMEVIFEPGTELDFVDGAGFISMSPVIMKGLENKKIRIISSDSSAMGFSVLQAGKRSYIQFTEFNGFNTLDYKGWVLTGAVNFYESDVDIQHTGFFNNYCEDALNIISSDFRVEDCLFKDIYSDAFDSDYCSGLVISTSFNRIGNDAIDFSTSQINIDNCTIDFAGDKGISGGEASKIKITNTTISNSNIGIAAKDLSELEVINTQISDCEYGFVGLCKKPEYGPSKIVANMVKCTNVETLLLIEEKSVINYNGEIIHGKEKKLADLFYSEEK